MDAILITGVFKGEKVLHASAIVPEDGKPPFHIVDSLLPGATTVFNRISDVVDFVERSYESGTCKYFAVPDAREREERKGPDMEDVNIRLSDGVFIKARRRVIRRELKLDNYL